MTNPLEQIRELANFNKESMGEDDRRSVTDYEIGLNHGQAEIAQQILKILTTSQGYVCVPVEVTRDAERYRWLSDNCQECPDALGMGGQLYFGTYSGMDGLDFAIDTAMLAASKETNRE